MEAERSADIVYPAGYCEVIATRLAAQAASEGASGGAGVLELPVGYSVRGLLRVMAGAGRCLAG